ncbi:protein kinase [Streptomyces sp. NPDC059247]|uniref:serine/threonine-protein kinase n=1 Tax=Streptomyces sp. NPDC059247 TaxID=3346790 RepID=UPI003689DF37
MSSGENERLAGRYRIVRRLGRGGMGVVWQAVDEVLGREVAVKELRTYSDAAAPELAGLRLRMTREARAAARVRHPGVVAVHDVTEHQGRPVIVMELVDGPSLDDVLGTRGPLEPAEAARIGAHVLAALAAAHDAGVLHRDVKPGNILLDRSGRIVLTDFGIATMEDPGDGSATRLTRSGEIVGSLDYLAPERAKGLDPGPASDVWALGATLYAAVEGASPFRRTSTWSTLAAIVADPLPEPVRAGPLAPLLGRLMAKDPTARPTAREAAALLADVATPEAPGTGAGGPAAPVAGSPVTGDQAMGSQVVGGQVVVGQGAPDPRVSSLGGPEPTGSGAGLAGPGTVPAPPVGPGPAPVGPGPAPVGPDRAAADPVASGTPAGHGPSPTGPGEYGSVPAGPAVPGAVRPPAGAFGPAVPPPGSPATAPGADRTDAVTGARAARRAAAGPRRGNTLVAASVVAVLLAGGGLTYGLMDRGGTGTGAVGEATGGGGGGGGGSEGGDRGRVLDPGTGGAPSPGRTGTARPSTGDSAAPAPSSPADGTDRPASGGQEPAEDPDTGTGTPGTGTAGSGGRSGGTGTDTTRAPGGGAATTKPPSGGGTAAPTTEAPPPAPGCVPAGSSATCQVVRSATTTRHDGGEMGTVGAGPHTFFCQVDLDHGETYGGRSSRWFARTDDDSGNTNVYLSVLHLSGGAGGGPVEGLRVC